MDLATVFCRSTSSHILCLNKNSCGHCSSGCWVSGHSPELTATGAKRPSRRNSRWRRQTSIWHPALYLCLLAYMDSTAADSWLAVSSVAMVFWLAGNGLATGRQWAGSSAAIHRSVRKIGHHSSLQRTTPFSLSWSARPALRLVSCVLSVVCEP